ncbi:hypothetical protein PybrP1_001970 [[Pythium] brassicae (nom. inval.)]|nr:hypothetical protein PybrP1_001970 [[Pythium] brassicae (nom. inval.)]
MSDTQPTHSDTCDSVGGCSARQMTELPGFKSAILPGHDSSHARVAHSPAVIDNVCTTGKQAAIYRSITRSKQLRQSAALETDEYSLIPAFRTALQSVNPGITTSCQIDSQGRFLRAFLALVAAVLAQEHHFPVFEADGTHIKSSVLRLGPISGYQLCASLGSSLGTLLVRRAGRARARREQHEPFPDPLHQYAQLNSHRTARTIRHTLSTMGCCNLCSEGDEATSSGSSVCAWRPTSDSAAPLSSPTVGTQIELSKHGVQLNLKFCCTHLIRNTVDQFSSVEPEIDQASPFAYRLQQCSTYRDYTSTLELIRECSPVGFTGRASSQPETVYDYLRNLHPTSWSPFGNYDYCNVKRDRIESEWRGVHPSGVATPHFGVRSTDGVEGENHALVWSHFRDQTPTLAPLTYCTRFAGVFDRNRMRAVQCQRSDFTATPRPHAHFSNELSGIARMRVTPHSSSCFLVKSVTGLSSLGDAANQGLPTLSTSQARGLAVPPYTRRSALSGEAKREIGRRNIQPLLLSTVQAFTAAFFGASVSVPLGCDVEKECVAMAPPLYRQTSRRTGRRLKKDAVTRHRQMRLKSAGENDGDIEHLRAGVNAAQHQKLKKFQCSVCHKVGHNKKSCTVNLVGGDDAGILPGQSVVGKCPFVIRICACRHVVVDARAITLSYASDSTATLSAATTRRSLYGAVDVAALANARVSESTLCGARNLYCTAFTYTID